MITFQDGITSLKHKADWSIDEDDEALANEKALNSIFNDIDKNMFKLINTCTEAKEAWYILRTAHEGTKVRRSRLQLLTTKFENLRMMDDESISDFNICLHDIANNSFFLGEKISEEKQVRKILRSLPKKFDMKVTLLRKTPLITVGKWIQPCPTNLCEVRCDCIYDTFHHGHFTVIISQVT